MIIDLRKFVAAERKYWEELESFLRKLENAPDRRLEISDLSRFHYLYERASSDLARIATFGAEKDVRTYLESLVARAYGEIHETRRKAHRIAPVRWFLRDFPDAFRRHAAIFLLAVAIFCVGGLFGGLAVVFDPQAKAVLMPFPELMQSPAERVKEEEQAKTDRLAGAKARFSALLMTHNTRISILTMAMGITWGVGTAILLFYNGVILGAVAADYVMAGQTSFLLGWLLPHGAVEIPSILIAGQAGLLLARAMIGAGNRLPFRTRMRRITRDLFALISGTAILLIWAGIIESFLSQYHQPVLPYAFKIAFGIVEMALLALFLSRSGRGGREPVQQEDAEE